MTIRVSREGWKARKPDGRTPFPGPLKGLAVHYTASAADEQDDHANCDDRVRFIQNYHMDTNGWDDIAYSWLVCRHNYIFEGRGFDVRPASQGTGKPGGNESYYSCCFLGNDRVGRKDVTDGAKVAIREVRAEVQAKGGHEARPHSYWVATGCPGNELRAWIGAGMPAPAKDPDEPTIKHFFVDFVNKDGVKQHRGPWNRKEVDDYAGNVITNHSSDPPGSRFVYIVTFDTDGEGAP